MKVNPVNEVTNMVEQAHRASLLAEQAARDSSKLRVDPQLIATFAVAQAVDRLTALLTPLVAETLCAIAQEKATGPQR